MTWKRIPGSGLTDTELFGWAIQRQEEVNRSKEFGPFDFEMANHPFHNPQCTTYSGEPRSKLGHNAAREAERITGHFLRCLPIMAQVWRFLRQTGERLSKEATN